jgi:excisionase family DNA binding protein
MCPKVPFFRGDIMSSTIRIQRICQQCGNEFTAKTTVTQTCSAKCRKAAYKSRKRGEKIEQSNRETLRIKVQPLDHLKSKPFLTVQELALLLNCSKRTAYRLINKGILPGVANLSERLTRIKQTEIHRLFEDQTVPYLIAKK